MWWKKYWGYRIDDDQALLDLDQNLRAEYPDLDGIDRWCESDSPENSNDCYLCVNFQEKPNDLAECDSQIAAASVLLEGSYSEEAEDSEGES